VPAPALRASAPPQMAALSPPALGVSIAKGLVGAGIFSLSARLIKGPGMVPAALLACVVGSMSTWTFYLLGRAAADTGSADNKSLWARTVGADTAWVYDVAVALVCFGGLVQFYSSMTQLLQFLAAALAAALPSAPAALAAMPYGLALAIVSAAMLPLALAKDLSALKIPSAIGSVGVLYAAVLTLTRAIDGSYRVGPFASTLTGPVTNIWGIQTFGGVAAFLGSINTAFLTHLGVPRFWNELRTTDTSGSASSSAGGGSSGSDDAARAASAAPIMSTSNGSSSSGAAALEAAQQTSVATAVQTDATAPSTVSGSGLVVPSGGKGGDSGTASAAATAAKLRVFGATTVVSFGAAVAVSITVMLSGYATFGSACDGLLFNNFAIADRGATLLRAATLVSIACLAPLQVLAFRDAVMPALCPNGVSLAAERTLRIGTALSAHLLAFCFRDVGLIISLRGALFGSLVTYCMPALIFLRSARGRAASPLVRTLHRALIGYGALMAGVGTTVVLTMR